SGGKYSTFLFLPPSLLMLKTAAVCNPFPWPIRALHTDRFGKVTFRCIVCSNQTDRECLSDGTTTSALFYSGSRVQGLQRGITPAAHCSALDQRGRVRSRGRTRTETLFTSPSQRACDAGRRDIL